MPEINLLPNELREKEEKEIGSTKKKARSFSVPLSSPQREKSEMPLTAPRSSLLSRLFYRPTPKTKLAPASEADSEIKKEDQAPKTSPEKIVFTQSEPLEKIESDLFADRTPSEKDVATDSIKTAPEPPAVKKNDSAVAVKEVPSAQKTPKKKFSFFARHPKLVDSKIEEPEGASKKNLHKKSFGRKHDEGDSVLDVNLIPSDMAKRPELELKAKAIKSSVAIFVTILLIIGTYLGITWYQLKIAQEIKSIEGQIKDYDGKIAAQEKEKNAALDLQQRLVLVKQLFDNHVYWTKFFALLEKYTSAEVYYTNFSMVGQDKLVISAVGKDYQSVARQLVAFQNANDFVKSVRIDSASARIDSETGKFDGVNFNVNLEFIPGVFIRVN